MAWDDTIRWPRIWGWLFAIAYSMAIWAGLVYLALRIFP